MGDHISESLPRLADAILEVGTRLGDISAELRTLAETAADRAPAPGVETGPDAPFAEPDPRAGHPAAPSPGPHPAAPVAGPDVSAPTPPSGVHTNPAPGTGATPPWPGGPAVGTTPPVGAQPPWTPQPQPVWRPGQPPLPYWAGPPTPPPPPGPTVWERLSRDGAGARILAWAGGAVTLAGVVLFLILAIQRGYLGPLPRVLLGAGLGLALTGIGAWLHRNPTARTGAYALAATGIAVLYLSVVAATTLYEYLPPWGGLVVGLAVTAGGIALAGVWDAQPLAVFVVVCCAVSAPVITEGFDGLLLAFLLVLLLGTTPVQLARKWSGLLLAAGAPPVVACLVNIAQGTDQQNPTTTAILAAVTSAVLILLATATALRRPADDFTLLVLVLGPAPGLLAAILLPRGGATVLPVAVGVLLLCVWLLGYAIALPRTFALAAGGVASLAFLQATATAFDGDARAIAFLVEALVLTGVAVLIRLRVALAPAGAFGAVGFLLGLVLAARPELITRPWRDTDVATAVSLGVTGLLYTAVALTFCWAVFRLEVLPDGERAPHGWVPAGLLALYGSTATILSIGLLISPDRDGFLLGHVLVTVSWTVVALVLLLRGIEWVPLRVAGLSLVVAALAKLVLFDLSSLDGLARVAAFLVAGLVLLGAGTRYAKLVATRGRS